MNKNLGQQVSQTNKGNNAKKIASQVVGETKKIIKDPKVKQSVRSLKKAFKDFKGSL